MEQLVFSLPLLTDSIMADKTELAEPALLRIAQLQKNLKSSIRSWG
jgi:hypothetical protein